MKRGTRYDAIEVSSAVKKISEYCKRHRCEERDQQKHKPVCDEYVRNWCFLRGSNETPEKWEV